MYSGQAHRGDMGMGVLYRIRDKVHQSACLQNIWSGVKSRVEINLFYLVQEGCFGTANPDLKPKLDEYTIDFLSPAEIETLTKNPETPESEEAFRKWLADGCLCLCLRHKGNIAAYMWAHLSRCEYRLLSFVLKRDEAYLFSARTFQAYRGKDLAPYLRCEFYKHLAQIGRSKIFSITDFFNVSSIKFKRKLKARHLRLYMQITLFKKYRYTTLLKNYRGRAQSGWQNADK